MQVLVLIYMKFGEFMKIKKGFSIMCKDDQNFIVCDKKLYPQFNSAIILTDTSLFLWNMLKNGTPSKEDMLNALLKEYDISTVLALNNIDIFIRTLKENGIITE